MTTTSLMLVALLLPAPDGYEMIHCMVRVAESKVVLSTVFNVPVTG